MANSSSKNDLVWEVDNKFIPKFIPNDLKWYEKDSLDTWYQQNKCNEFINNTDTYFKNFKKLQKQICSSIFRRGNRKDMHIPKQAINKHFKNKKVCTGRGRFIKKIRDDMYAQYWLFLCAF